METNKLILYVLDLECKLFMKMDSYRLIEQKCDKKCLAPDERQRLNADIHYVFTWLIKTMKEECPSSTEEDIIFCCLAKLGFDNITIGRCMGNASRDSIYQRKHRIKEKMHEAQCDALFDMIFTPDYTSFL